MAKRTGDPAVAQAIGEAFTQMRLETGLSQYAFAHSVGISSKHYQELERGRKYGSNKPTNPTMSQVVKICEGFRAQLGPGLRIDVSLAQRGIAVSYSFSDGE